VKINLIRLLGILLIAVNTASAQWVQFRGPQSRGIANTINIPTQWGEDLGIQWKTAISGEGWSSPVIDDGLIWMTSAYDEGKSLHAVCVDQASGKVLMNEKVIMTENVGPKHVQNGFASPTPVINDGRVYVHFGPRGTVCLDFEGNILWKRTDMDFDVPQGAASSPIIHKDKLILICDGTDEQYVAALDKNTGKTLWKTPRQHHERISDKGGFFRMAYSTPLIVEVNGHNQILASGAEHAAGYDVETGEELWFHKHIGFSQVGQASHGNGFFYLVGSVSQDHFGIFAIKEDARGEVTSGDVVWSNPDGIGHVPTPLLAGKEIYVVTDDGTAQCIDALTGESVWRERLGGRFRASPIKSGNHIYFVNEEGDSTVVKAGRNFDKVATNKLEGLFLATPAISQTSLFLRSDKHLYRIGK